ncbi:branched-chain amino acid transport system II carrier protein, partial [Streptococcus agalactiae]|nr:branched-chain amino acid transport system II carrier protein [Streptococcus agalactiae]
YFGGLSEIIRWSLPVLYLLYPLTIVLIFLVFFDQKFESSCIVYQTSIAATAVAALYDALSKLGEMTGLFTIPSALTTFFTKVVPLGEYSMGWISFAICGVLV